MVDYYHYSATRGDPGAQVSRAGTDEDASEIVDPVAPITAWDGDGQGGAQVRAYCISSAA